MSEELGAKTDRLQRFDVMLERLMEHAEPVEFGKGSYILPAVQVGDRTIQFMTFVPESPDTPYSPSILELSNTKKHYTRRADLDPFERLKKDRKMMRVARRGQRMMERLLDDYLELVPVQNDDDPTAEPSDI